MKEQINIIAYFKNKAEINETKQSIYYDTSDCVNVINIDVPDNTSEVYIHFDSIVVLKDLEIVSNEGKLKYINLNGVNIENLDFFINEEPKISINLDKKQIRYLRLRMEVYKFSREHVGVLSDFIEFINNYKFIKEKEMAIESELRDLVRYKEKYFEVSKRNQEIENKLVVLREQYDCLVNSKCWKITKPVRVCLDILKRNKLVKLMLKVKNNIKVNGVKYTYGKVKTKLGFEKNNCYVKNNFLTTEEIEKQKNIKFSRDIKISVVLALGNVDKVALSDSVNSVLTQTYNNLELLITTYGNNITDKYEQEIKGILKSDTRVKYKKLNNGIEKQESIENAFNMATGQYILLLNENDMLSQNALYEIMKAICEYNADFIYSDEDKFNTTVKECFDPYFKPDFSPDTLRTHNYISNLIVFDKNLLEKINKSKKQYKTAYDYDLTFRLTEKAKKVYHIQKILYHMKYDKGGECEYVFPKQYESNEAKEVIGNHLERIGRKAEILDTDIENIYRVKYKLNKEPLVSIIILNRDKISYLKKCINSIISKSTYKNYEILIVENNSIELKTFDYYKELKNNPKIRVITFDKSKDFNFSEINNYAVEFAKGEVLLLLNNDIEVIANDWLEEMLMYVQQKDVGIIGAKLYYQSGALQHVGVGIGSYGPTWHYFQGVDDSFNGYFGRLHCVQNLSAVTGACIMLRKEVYEEVNGLDEGLEIAYNDIDLCLKIIKRGYSVIWNPYVKLYHFESVTRGYNELSEEKLQKDKEERKRFMESWKHYVNKGDPYYNINLPNNRQDFKFDD